MAVVVLVAMVLCLLIAPLRAKKTLKRLLWVTQGLILKILGIKVRLEGNAKTKEPVIIVSPHYSWLDPLLISYALGTNVAFVATKEVRNWLIFGRLAALNDTIFIDRQNRATITEQTAQMKEAIAQGYSVVFFPEGSSGNGNRVRPFKSSLFATAMDMGLKVQPLAMAYTGLDGIPPMRLFRHCYAWYGDTNFVEHIQKMLRLGSGEVSLRAGKLLDSKDFANRKQLSHKAEHWVTQTSALLLTGNS